MIQHWYGNVASMKSVSHADWCLAMMTAGPAGTFSQPAHLVADAAGQLGPLDEPARPVRAR